MSTYFGTDHHNLQRLSPPLLTFPSIWPLAERGALNDFCLDLTARAADGKIDPVIGREKEVQRVIQILGRRTKNNPILLGEPGVGKTAIAEGLAIAIVGNEVPDFLQVWFGYTGWGSGITEAASPCRPVQ